jgi:hypothetical protein
MQNPALSLRCRSCEQPLRLVQTIFNGSDRQDWLTCPDCLRVYAYEHTSERLRVANAPVAETRLPVLGLGTRPLPNAAG